MSLSSCLVLIRPISCERRRPGTTKPFVLGLQSDSEDTLLHFELNYLCYTVPQFYKCFSCFLQFLHVINHSHLVLNFMECCQSHEFLNE